MQMPVAEVARELQDLGFERGWGATVGRVRDTMHMLLDLMQAPDAEVLQARLLPLSKSLVFLACHSLGTACIRHEYSAGCWFLPSQLSCAPECGCN